MPKFKTTQNGQEIEVEIPEETVVEWGYLTKAEVQKAYIPKANVEATIQAAKGQQERATRQQLQEDPDFRKEILSGFGIPLDDEGKPKLPEGGLSAEEVQKQLQQQQQIWESQWKKKLYDPLEQKLESVNGENTVLRQRMLVSDLIQAAKSAGVKGDKFEVLPGTPLEAASVVSQLMHRFAWAPDAKMWALKSGVDAAGNAVFEISSGDDPSRPYAGPEALFAKLKEDKAIAARWFEDERISTDRLGNTNGRSSGGNVATRAEFDRMTPQERMNFSKAGGKVE